MKKAIILTIALLFAHDLICQLNDFSFNFQKITLEDGLTDNKFNDFVFQDSKGFVWISSMNGINRFDGLNIRKFKSENGLIGENIQGNFYEDNQGNIWFSSYIGLNCYRPAQDSIFHYPICYDWGEEVGKGLKIFHLNKRNQEIWVRGDDYFFKIPLNDLDAYQMLPEKTSGYHFDVVADSMGENIKKIISSPWLGKGIEIFYLQNEDIINKKKYLENIKGIKKCVHINSNELLLVSKTNLFLFDENKGDTVQVIENKQNFEFWDAIKVDSNLFLISTNNRGLWSFNLKKREFTKQWKHNESSSSLLSNSPRFIHLHNNNLWINHHLEGINYTNLSSNAFENPLIGFLRKESDVTSIIETENGDFWTTIGQGQLIKLAKEHDFLPKSVFNSAQGLMLQVNELKKGTLFFQTANSLFSINSESNKISEINNPDDLQFRYSANIYPRRKIITTTTGIKEIIETGDSNFSINVCSEFENIDGYVINNFFSTKSNKLYFTYLTDELWIYESKVKGLNEITKLKFNKKLFDITESVYYPNLTWAATSNGLIKITQDTILQSVFSENALLATKAIYSVVEDNNGYLWLTTNKGLWQYHPETKVLNHYDEEDGLNGDIFSLYNSAIMSSQNEIWLGTNKGLITFDPKKIKPYAIPPKVYIDHLLINDETEIKGIGVKDELELESHQSTLLFDVLPVLLYKADRARVEYKLVGYDSDWLSVKNGQKIRYTKIPHGEYIFEVMAEDVNGNRSEVKQLAITINPHFTETGLFFFLMTLLSAALMYALYRYRVAQIREDQAKKTAIAELELQVAENELKALRAQMNPHFLFNAMNSIKGIIIQQEVNQAITYLTKFSMLIRTILANSEKKSILLKNELEALQLYIELEALRFTGSFKFQINVDRTVDKTFVRIPPLILQPFVENAIWHGLMPKADADNKLLINIFRKEDFILCEIEDNGIGRKQAQARKKNKKHDSMGIGITEKRITMLHPDNEVFIVDLADGAGQGTGTKVIVKIFAPD